MYAVLTISSWSDKGTHTIKDCTVVPYTPEIVKCGLLSDHTTSDTFSITDVEVRCLVNYYKGIADKYRTMHNDMLGDAAISVASHLAWLANWLHDDTQQLTKTLASVCVLQKADVKYADREYFVRCMNCGKLIYYYKPTVRDGKLLCNICSAE